MDNAALWLQFGIMALIGIIGIYYQRRAVRLLKPEEKGFAYWPLVFMVVLAASSWIPYFLRPDDLPAFPEPDAFVRSYSVDWSAGECDIVANGKRFWKYEAKYKIASACFIWDRVGDIVDSPQLQVSRAYNITKSDIPMRVLWGPGFRPYLLEKHATSMTTVVLLLPIGVDPGEFSTLRQAQALKVRIVTAGITGHS